MRRASLLLLVFSIESVASASPAEEYANKAIELYRAEKFAKAAEAFEKAYQLRQTLQNAFGFAQALRKAGDCKRATKLYRVALTLDPTARQAEAIAESLARCEAELKREQPTKPKEEKPKEEKPKIVIEKPKIVEADPWYLDPLGLTLSGVGVVAIGTGTVLFFSSRSDELAAQKIVNGENGTRDDKKSLTEDAKRGRTVSIVALSVGAALIGVATYRFLTLDDSPQPAAKAGVTTLGFSPNGLVIGGRF